MTTRKPKVKILDSFDPVKFGVVYGDWPIEPKDTFKEAIDEANFIGGVRAVLNPSVRDDPSAAVDALDHIFPEPS